MKKNLLYVLALATSMVACTEDYTDWAEPQQNGAETPQSVTFSATDASAITIANVTGETVTIFSPSVTAEEGATASYVVTLTPTEADYADKSATLTTTDGTVATDALVAAVESMYGKRPTERVMTAAIVGAIDIAGQAIKVTDEVTLKVTLDAPEIASAYYLIGDYNGWSTETMKKFSRSTKDVYDDPYFTVIFSTTADNQYWKIIPQTNVDAGNAWANPGVLGVETDGDDSMEGQLITKDGNGPGAAKIATAGLYMMTINMMEYTYSIKELVPEYFIVGAMQGWSITNKSCMLYPQSKMVHSYTTCFGMNVDGSKNDGNLKIWLGSDFGNWDVAYGSLTDGDASEAGALTGAGAGAMVVPEMGAYYTITIDMENMQYNWKKLEDQAPVEYANMAMIGGFNGWGGDLEMTQVTPHNWCYLGFVSEGTELKFRSGYDWADNWGPAEGQSVGDVNYGVGVGGGANIVVPAGTYNIFFNDITKEFVFSIAE